MASRDAPRVPALVGTSKLRFYEEFPAPVPFNPEKGSGDLLMLLRPAELSPRIGSTLLVLRVVDVADLPRWPQRPPVSAEPASSDLDRQNQAALEKLRASRPLPPRAAASKALCDRVSLWSGNLVALNLDCLCNSANEALLGGGGVDGIIHFVAGAPLKFECHALPGPLQYKTPSGVEMRVRCQPGEAVLTGGHGLPAKYLVHTVGPYLDDQGRTQPQVLAACYRNALNVARARGVRTICFPRISTTYYGFPAYEAACIGFETVRTWLEANPHTPERPSIELVVFATGPVPGDRASEIMHLAAEQFFPPI